MNAPKKFHIGQEVVVTAYGKTRTATVTKVGRTLVYVGRDAYRIDTGGLNSGRPGTIRTPEERADLDQRTELRGRAWKSRHMLRDLPHTLTTDQLRRIVAILEETP